MDKIFAALLLTAGMLAANGAELTVNNREVSSGFTDGGESWRYEQTVDLTKKETIPEEYLISNIKQHPQYGHICGYNGDITLKFKAPGPISVLEGNAVMANFVDDLKREISFSWSLDGNEFHSVDTKILRGGDTPLSGKVTLPPNKGSLFVRFSRKVDEKDINGRNGFVVWQKLKLKLTGQYGRIDAVPDKVSNASPCSLKKVFPTGVFWAWERTRPNAEFAKMEFWKFVEYNMQTLRENGYNTLWFVNFEREDEAPMLALAEKYGMRVIFNTDLLGIFYHGLSSLEQLRDDADRTVSRIGDSKALLGYVLKDEPLLCDIETCNNLYDAMKKADPARDSTAVVMNRQSLNYLRESKLPVICSDIYYFGDKDSTQLPAPRNVSQFEFTNALKSYGEAAELYGKHTWFMGQMFGHVWGRYYRKDDKLVVYPGAYLHWRMPTEAESRWQIWEALRLGTKGVFFYVFHAPIQLTIPPEQVTDPKQKKMVEEMDFLAREAAGWKTQKLTTKTIQIDPGEGMLDPGGKPTRQMLATGPVMKLIRKYETLLVERRKMDFPVVFPGDALTDTATFISGGRYICVAVNRDLDNKRKTNLKVAANVSSVRDLGTGTVLPLSPVKNGFRTVTLDLAAGDGALLEARFIKHPGIRLCIEKFDMNEFQRLSINSNAEIFHYGNLGADANRALRLKKGAGVTQPVCELLSLTNPKTAQRTFANNLNLGKRLGTIYCQLSGKLTSAMVKAVRVSSEGEQANTMHLANAAQSGKTGQTGGEVIQSADYYLPAVVPTGTTALEFYLRDPGDYIDDITVWFIPD